MSVAPSNWIADNRNAEQPPAYFLQRLYDFDAMLVLMPSREQHQAYVLGRRKQWGPGVTAAGVDAIYTKTDTRMCILNGAVPVCMVFKPAQGSWDPAPLIRTLMARDIWTHGGAEKVADLLESQEEADRVANKAAIRADLYHRSGDAWRSYQARTGQTSNLFKVFPTPLQDSPAPGLVMVPD